MTQSSNVDAWLTEHRIQSVEMLVSDMAGLPRGRVLPVSQLKAVDLKLPAAVFAQTVSGSFFMRKNNVQDRDMYCRPDLSTLRLVPWAKEPMASVILDCHHEGGQAVDFAPRAVLARVIDTYRLKGWRPIVAPEVEFYLTRRPDGDPAEMRLINVLDPYGIDSLQDIGDFFQLLSEYCRLQDIALGGVSQEQGPAQFEVNFPHGAPLELADDVVRFKRTLRRAAHAHGMQVTFLAKPSSDRPGSALHIHQSVLDESNRNIFSDTEGRPTRLFDAYLAGLQQHMLEALLLFAPYANSYRRLLNYYTSPVNLEWGVDNRTVGLRVPHSEPGARRVENRLAGSDVNPYLAIAGTLACGYLGMVGQLTARAPIEGSAYELPFSLNRDLYESLDRFGASAAMRETLGDDFVSLYCDVKGLEHRAFQERITDWEREDLMFRV